MDNDTANKLIETLEALKKAIEASKVPTGYPYYVPVPYYPYVPYGTPDYPMPQYITTCGQGIAASNL